MADVKFDRVTDIRTPHEGAVTIIGNTAEGQREVEIPAFDVSGVIVGLVSMFPQLKGEEANAGAFEASGFQLTTNNRADFVTMDFEITPIGSVQIAVPASWLKQMADGISDTAKLLAKSEGTIN